MDSLHDRVILVTGGAKRLGRTIAQRLYTAGAKVAIHYGSSEADARAVAAECGQAPVFQANLESVDSIKALFRKVQERCGRLDGLVNNAARFTRKDPLEITEEDWDFIHSVNLKATFFACQQAALIMKEQGSGRIVNISSMGGLHPWANHAHYCASKAGVIMMTKALAKAWAPHITVNSVAPGVIPMGKYDDRIERLIRLTPACREGEPDEVADAVLFFLGATNFITGQTIAVDGGLGLK